MGIPKTAEATDSGRIVHGQSAEAVGTPPDGLASRRVVHGPVPDGGGATAEGLANIRILGCGGVIRRLVGRAVGKELQQQLKEAVGPRQYGMQQDGCGRIHRAISTHAATQANTVVVALDIADAFTSIHPSAVLPGCAAHPPVLSPVAEAWCGRPTTHVLPDGGTDSKVVTQYTGLDQGCPLSPAFYSLATHDALSSVRAAMKAIDAEAEVYVYLDDTYLVGGSDAVRQGMATFVRDMGQIGPRTTWRRLSFGPPI